MIKNTVRSYFSRLGLSAEFADIYLALHTFGPQTISQLARNSGVERTRIYRLADQMAGSSLVETEVHYRRTILKAAPIANLQILIAKKEEELRNLQSGLQQLQDDLDRSELASPLTHIQFYRGPEGMKQMFWNQTKTKTGITAILYENMQNRTNATFFERWVEKCNSRHLPIKGIVGDHFIKTQQEWYASHSNERLNGWEARYVPDNLFKITHSTIVYDDVVGYYNWKDGEVFGIEIYNQEIADAQRQFFAMLWAGAKPVDDVKGL